MKVNAFFHRRYWGRVLSNFINLTQVHNFTVSAHNSFTFRRHSVFIVTIYRNFASTNAGNETICTVLLTSQEVMIQSLQLKDREFESTYVLFLPLFYSFNFIYYRCTTTSGECNFG